MHDSRSIDATRVVTQARTEAQRLGHAQIGTEHLLLGLLGEEESEAADLLRTAGCTLASARHMVSEVVIVTDPTSPAHRGGAEDGSMSPRAERALNRAGRFARQERAGETTARHVLLGVLDVEGLACQVLRRLEVDLAGLRRAAGGTFADAVPQQPPTLGPDEATGTEGGVEGETWPPAVRPTCAGCGVALADTLTVDVIDADEVAGGPTPVRIAYCAACGRTVGTVG